MPRTPKLPRRNHSARRDHGWVAVTSSGVAGRGLTAGDAQAAAKLSRLKDSTQVIYLPLEQSPPLALPPIFDRVRGALPEPERVCLVGGSVRDSLLHHPIHDLDFVVEGDGLSLAREVARRVGGAFYPLDEERGTGRVVVLEEDERFYLDFAQLRGDSLTTDLAARDFTINAMAVSLTPPERLIDPMGGQADLKAKVLRMCRPTSFADDPVRILRAIRLAAQLDFRLERSTREAARAASRVLLNVSAERMRDEFIRVLGGRRPAASLRALDALGALVAVVPEAAALKGVTQSPPHLYEVWEHTLMVVDKLEALLAVLGRTHDVDAASEFALGYAAARVGRYRRQLSDHLEQELSFGRSTRSLLFFSALLHDIAKPLTRTVEPEASGATSGGRIRFFNHEEAGAMIARQRATALRLSVEEVGRIVVTVAAHMRPVWLSQEAAVTRRAIYRFFKATGAAGVDVCLLTLADLLGTRGIELGQEEWTSRVDTVVALLEAYFFQLDAVVRPAPLITGDDVINELSLRQGPRIGEILEAVREAQAAGEVTTREEALELARKMRKDE